MAKPSPLMPVDVAQSRIVAAFSPLAPETIALNDALGRVLASDLQAKLTQPPFNASAMDGYAVRAADVRECPVSLKLKGEAAAGGDVDLYIGQGEAARIFTGGVVPEGADTIIIQENTTRSKDGLIHIDKGSAPGRHIRLRGQDFKAGDTLLTQGTLMGPRALALASAAGCARVEVRRRPRIGILATGNELVRLGAHPGPSQIINSNTPALAALITLNGGTPVDMGIAADTPESLSTLANADQKLDLLVTIGGASVGDHDLIQKVLGEEGLKVDFWRIAMRPGKPLLFGDFKGKPFLGLPGNPVSAMVCGIIFILPAICRMLGQSNLQPNTAPAILSLPLPQNDERQEYMRATIDAVAGVKASGLPQVRPVKSQDSSLISLMAAADCLIVRPAHAAAANAGDRVDIISLKAPIFQI